MNIEVFYHVYIPEDNRAQYWVWWIDQQLGCIRSSNLHLNANVNVCITMPMWWPTDGRLKLHVNGNRHIPLLFQDKVKEYIRARYPWANVVDMRDSGQENIYEGATLRKLWEKCQDLPDNRYVLYFHNKGANSNTPEVANWRELLNYFMITKWEECISHLQDHELVGMKDHWCPEDQITSGNFWWSTSDYIKTLKEPLDSRQYTNRHFPDDPTYRYAFELWITQKKPKIKWVYDTKTDHFDTYYFLENILKDKA